MICSFLCDAFCSWNKRRSSLWTWWSASYWDRCIVMVPCWTSGLLKGTSLPCTGSCSHQKVGLWTKARPVSLGLAVGRLWKGDVLEGTVSQRSRHCCWDSVLTQALAKLPHESAWELGRGQKARYSGVMPSVMPNVRLSRHRHLNAATGQMWLPCRFWGALSNGHHS